MSGKILLTVLVQVLFLNIASSQESARFKQINKAFLSPDSKVILIASHRGTHNTFTENSMAAFKKGIELGIDVIEIDVRHTKDDSLVIMHDGSVDRTTNGKYHLFLPGSWYLCKNA